jgi:AcrR family transcriptional regulator
VAREVGTTTRAVYSLFGSKEGLPVDALAQSAYAFLAEGMAELPETDDPVADSYQSACPSFARSFSSTPLPIGSRSNG